MPYPSSTVYPSSTLPPGSDTTTGGGTTGTVGGVPYPSNTLWPSSDLYPGAGGSTDVGGDPGGGGIVLPPGSTSPRLRWDNPTDRQFEAGLDRGVLYPKTAPAVVWNGLTSMEEKGGEASTVYYIDGRPFLYLPQPKEFSATLSAFTYPEEFLPMMGVVEAADGMYLDSQMGDTFDLSYRTLIGDAVTGEKAGYRIHLVYNASVAPPSSSYATLSDSINPSEFSWDIDAVPMTVPGHRATAHVIIDTRHMEPDRLQLIEALLYGTGNSMPRIPDPGLILDLLGYGDVITITDNGDGTWTAEGSYENIVIYDDGSFKIINVDAIDNGDGSYVISTTNV